MKKRIALVLVIILALCCVLIGCQKDDNIIRISTTTSVNDSGLLTYLQPIFEKETGYTLKIASAGTGVAIKSAQMGNADLILVHAKGQEETFIASGFARKVEGYSAERLPFMYNFFVLAGNKADPLAVKGKTAKEAFQLIMANNALFVSRGDNSGTHSAEKKIWKTILTDGKDEPTFENYSKANAGMGTCLTQANEKSGYVFTDKSTYLSFKKNPEGDKLANLDILVEQSEEMKNTYSLIAVNQDAKFVNESNVEVKGLTFNTKGADDFIKWMTKESTYKLINEYGQAQYNERLFFTLDIK